jgi:radical SAM protein with 4Fe4S-binding SPASM domain
MPSVSKPTVIARVAGRDCIVEPSSATWYVCAPDASTPIEPHAERLPGDGELTVPHTAALSEVWLYTNLDCNLTCSHCFLGESTRGKAAARPSFGELSARIEEAARLGARTVFLTGGEPCLRDDLPELLAYGTERLEVAVFTNATLIDEGLIARFDAAGVRKERLSFQVSIDGVREVHDAVRGAGTFARSVRAIELLREWGARPALVTALAPETVAGAPLVTALAADLGLHVHHLLLPFATDGCDSRRDPISPEVALAAIRACRAIAETTGITLSNDALIAARVRRPGRRYDGCTGGSSMVAVAADGAVYPCPVLVGSEAHSAPGQPIATARECMPIAEFAAASVCDRGGCSACAVRHFCGGGCPAHSVRGDHEAEPYCEVYRGLVTDHIEREAARLLAGDPKAAMLHPELHAAALPVRHRFACT